MVACKESWRLGRYLVSSSSLVCSAELVVIMTVWFLRYSTLVTGPHMASMAICSLWGLVCVMGRCESSLVKITSFAVE